MRLTKLVPALGLFAAIAAPVSAIELADGTLSIGGDVTVTFAIEDDGDDTTLKWMADANLNVGYRIGEDVSAYLSLDFAEDSVAVDEAYITWAFADNLSLTVGEYATWIGYQPMTINDSLTVALEGVNAVGAAVTFAQDDLEITLHVVNSIWEIDPADEPTLAFGLFVGYHLEGMGTIGGSISYEPSETLDDIIGINVFAELDGLVDDMIFGADFNYAINAGGNIDIFAAMVYANYTLPTDFPASVTGAFSILDVDGGEAQDFLVQLALLTNPTGNENFELNFEFSYLSGDSLDDDAIGFFIEFVAIIP